MTSIVSRTTSGDDDWPDDSFRAFVELKGGGGGGGKSDFDEDPTVVDPPPAWTGEEDPVNLYYQPAGGGGRGGEWIGRYIFRRADSIHVEIGDGGDEGEPGENTYVTQGSGADEYIDALAIGGAAGLGPTGGAGDSSDPPTIPYLFPGPPVVRYDSVRSGGNGGDGGYPGPDTTTYLSLGGGGGGASGGRIENGGDGAHNVADASGAKGTGTGADTSVSNGGDGGSGQGNGFGFDGSNGSAGGGGGGGHSDQWWPDYAGAPVPVVSGKGGKGSAKIRFITTYSRGIKFSGCCCGPPCDYCSGGSLPENGFIVEFDGDVVVRDATDAEADRFEFSGEVELPYAGGFTGNFGAAGAIYCSGFDTLCVGCCYGSTEVYYPQPLNGFLITACIYKHPESDLLGRGNKTSLAVSVIRYPGIGAVMRREELSAAAVDEGSLIPCSQAALLGGELTFHANDRIDVNTFPVIYWDFSEVTINVRRNP